MLQCIRNVNVKGYGLVKLDCLEKHSHVVMKHVLVCDAAKQLVVKDEPVVKIASELRTLGLAYVLSVRCGGCNTSLKLVQNC